jgi:hypothetical protein
VPVQGESLNFSAPKIFRIHVKLRQTTTDEQPSPPRRQKNLGQCTISGLKKFSGQVHCKCCPVTLPQFFIPKFGKGSFCAKLLRQINICDQSAPKMCAKFCSSHCSAPKIFRKYTLKFTLGASDCTNYPVLNIFSHAPPSCNVNTFRAETEQILNF